MKTTGWVLLSFGVLSFAGAALQAHSVFGPCFFIALGAYLVYRAKQKEEANEEANEEDSERTDNGVSDK